MLSLNRRRMASLTFYTVLAAAVLAGCGRGPRGYLRDRISFTAEDQDLFTGPDAQTAFDATQSPYFGKFENQGESQKDKDAQTEIPPSFSLESPVKEPFDISYFYGPRILGSLPFSLDLENHREELPVSLPVSGDGSGSFLTKYWQFHTGVDFAVPQGTPVYAVGAGEIFAAGYINCPGRVVVLKMTEPKSGHAVYALYEHLLSIGQGLKTGSLVKAGDRLGLSGHSGEELNFKNGTKEGCVEGDHLHFELRTATDKSANSSSLSSDVGARWNYIYTSTAKINPADYIKDVEQKCEIRRAIELTNASILEKSQPGHIPLLTAGRCSRKFENQLPSLPRFFMSLDGARLPSRL